jgi:acyl transferase domain-containing protein/thioesterase domain-containing protein
MTEPDARADSDIAIVGMAGRFPGARNVDELWSRVVAGEDCLTDLDVDQLVEAGVPADVANDPAYVRRAGVLDDVAGFDPGFFGIGPGDAAVMDPQHRHFLECGWEALESAGHVPERFSGAIGVFGGCGMNTYLLNNLLTNPTVLPRLGWFLLRHTGNDKDFFVSNVAYRLDLRGPAVNVQTACSTSLVAVHLAVQSLLAFECDLALAGGATIEVPHGVGYRYHEGEILSPDGRCRAFDAESAGTVLTSGVGVVALRRLADALADGDPVLAVIKGSAVNNDGSRKVGFLAPSVDGHADVVREALTVAGLSARDLQLVEAHGTGTAVGDPIEVAALTEAFRTWTTETGFCRLTSTKPNIGHLDTAAGVASLIKVVQALGHRTLPPLANHTAPSPLLDLERTPFVLSGLPAPWPDAAPRRAGVSSLGVGGTNAHVVVEEAPPMPPSDPARPEQPLVLSAASPEALDDAARRLADHLDAHPSVELADVAHTLATGRRAMAHRRVVTATSTTHAASLLRAPDRHRSHTARVPDDGRVRLGFMFPGGGSQYPGMGAGLDARFEVFHAVRDDGAARVRALGGPDLTGLLRPSGDPDLLRRPTASLPAVFLTSVALARQWMALGARPDVLIGHSLGEYAAAHLAGVISFDDALSLVVTRSRLMEQVSGTCAAMAVVPLTETDVRAVMPAALSLAAVNADDECVVAGPADAVSDFTALLASRDITSTTVPLAAAAHSTLLEPVLAEFLTAVRGVELRAPQVPYPSNLTGTWITAEQATNPQYWVDHLRHTVRFLDCLRTVLDGEPLVLTELGPGQALSSYARRATPRPLATVPALRHPDHDISDTAFTIQAFVRQWAAGAPVDPAALIGPGRRRRLRLPTYPFQHQRCWIEPGPVGQPTTAPASSSTAPTHHDESPSAPTLTRIDHLDQACWVVDWQPAPEPTPATAGVRWLVVGSSDRADRLSHELGRRGRHVVRRRDGTSASDEALAEVDAVLVVADTETTSFEAHVQRWLDDTGALAVGLGRLGRPTRLVAVTERALGAGGRADRATDALASGVVLVAPREYPSLTTRLVDVEPTTPDATIIDEALAEGPVIVALRGSVRQTPVTVPAPPDASDGASFVVGGTYLVTGGLGGVGHALAKHLVHQHRANVVVVSSQPVPTAADRFRWLARHAIDDPTSRRIRHLQELEAAGTKVAVVVADVADPGSLRTALDEAERLVGRLDGAIHAAGVVRDRLLELATSADHRAVVGAKAQGALVLADELRRRGGGLLVLVSSTSTLLAPQGQAAYVAANSVLDALAGQDDGLRVVTMDFGLWSSVGIASTTARRSRLGIGETVAVEHPVLAERWTDRDGTNHLVGSLDPGAHWVVDEHRLGDGVAVLPGTAHLDLMLAALALTGREGAHLTGVTLLAPLVAPDGVATAVRVSITADEPAVVRVESFRDDEGAWVVHSEAHVGWSPWAAGQQRHALGGELDALPLPVADPLEGPRRHLRLGPRWESVRRASRGDGVIVAELELPAAVADDADAWRLHPALADVATALGVYLATTAPADHVVVPVAYADVWVRSPLPGRLTVRAVRRPESAPETVRVDLLAADDQGDAVFEICGLELRPVPATRWTEHTEPAPIPARRVSGRSLADLADELGLRATEGAELVERLLRSGVHRLVGSSIPLDDLRRLIDEPAGARPASAGRPTGTSVEAAIRAMWVDLLGVADVSDDDDFFDLGGHSLVAIRLMSRIQRELGVRLQLANIFDASTVAALAARVRAERPDIDRMIRSSAGTPLHGEPAAAVTTFSHLVPITTEGPGRPLYIVHGAGGNVLFLWSLARAMSGQRPIYGFQAHGIEGRDLPDPTIEQMAARYVAELREHAPGPYLLGGFSGGGLVALEMVRQLQAVGEQVDCVVLFDSVPAGRMQPGRLARWRRLAGHVRRHGIGPLRPYLRQQLANGLHRVLPERSERTAEHEQQERALGYADTGAHGFVNLFYYFTAAAERYETGVYDVDAILLKADHVWPTQPEDYHWRSHLMGDLIVRTVPGDHHSMFYPEHAPRLAAVLGPLLELYDVSPAGDDLPISAP